MQITCPHCQFTKELNLDKIPATAEIATCPKCYQKFRFRTLSPSVARQRVAERQPAPPEAWRGEPIRPEENKAPSAPPPPPVPSGADELTVSEPAPEENAMAHPESREPEGAPNGEQENEHAHGEEPKPPRPKAPPRFELGGDEPGEKKPEAFWDHIESMGGEQRDPFEERAASYGRRAGDIPSSNSEDEEEPESDVPWERLEQYGFFQGFFQTLKAAMFSPTAFFEKMPVGGGTLKPLTFMLLIAELQAVSQFLMIMVGGVVGQADATGLSGLFMGVGSFFMLVFYPIMYAAALYLSAAINHLFLMLFQSGSRGFEGTFRAVCYGGAPLILSVLPFIGPFIGGIWGLVTTIIAYKCIHQATYPRVAAAILTPIFLILLLAVFAVFIAGKFSPS
jgi:hypothetical protein